MMFLHGQHGKPFYQIQIYHHNQSEKQKHYYELCSWLSNVQNDDNYASGTNYKIMKDDPY